MTTARTLSKPRQKYIWYLFVGPMIIGLILFHGYPIFESLRMSFYKTNLTSEAWRGLRNYEIVFSNKVFWLSVSNTLYLGFWQLVLSIPLSFILASLINLLKTGRNTIKVIYFIPYITPVVAAATMYLQIVDYQGLLNSFIGLFGIPGVEWLRYPTTAQWAVIIFNIWKGMGYTIMIVLANLQAIPPEYYEAASVDGCDNKRAWWYITLPNMKFTLYFLLINGMIASFQRFSDVFVIGGTANSTLGGPERALYTIVCFIYERGFGSYDFGVASAAAYVMFMMIMVLTLISVKSTKLFGNEGQEGR